MSGEFSQPPLSLFQGFDFLTEAETNQLSAASGIIEEARPRNSGNADFFDQVPGELHVVWKTEARNVRHHVVGAKRAERAETSTLEHAQDEVAPFLILDCQILIVVVR